MPHPCLHRIPSALCVPALALALLATAGCSGDVGLSTGGDQSGDLGDDDGAVALATSDYLVLDIASGQLTALKDAPDLSGSAYRDNRILFRRIDAPSGDALIAVFELTQAQYQDLGGGTPWTSVPTSVVPAAAIAATRPAYNLSYDGLAAVLAAYESSTGVDLDVPSSAQWVAACAAGSSRFAWGDGDDRATVRGYAWTADTIDGTDGPRAVGSLTANKQGFYDLHGNVWEWCDQGTAVRGGSWSDTTHSGRAGNALDKDNGGIQSFTSHAFFGARLILRP